MKKLWDSLLDWAACKLDLAACKAVEKSRIQDVPAPKTPPGPKTGLLPDGHFSYVDESGPFTHSDYIAARRHFLSTPDRPTDPIRREIDALTGKAEAVNYPRGS